MHTHPTCQLSRRTFLARQGFVGAGAVALAATGHAALWRGDEPVAGQARGADWPGFPHQDPALVREVVGASHSNIKRVKELVGAHPALARASYDWGYGDWETALGAASHVGNQEIAALLLEHGARLDIFAAAMLGMTEVVKGILDAQPALARVRGPHGISLVAHAAAGKNADLVEFLKTVSGAGDDPANPLSAEEMKVYLGTYSRDAGPALIVSQTRFGMALKVEGQSDVRLTRTGEHTFYPAGAPNVRIAFTVQDGTARRIEIVEADWMVMAERTSG